jgi:starch phosphorylase
MLGRVVDLLRSGFFSPDDRSRGAGMAAYLEEHDPFLVCADFDDYCRVTAEASNAYRDRPEWMRRVVKNIASMSSFSSDATIARYARDIWHATPVTILEEVGG